MQKYRLAILLPEVIDAVRKESLRILESEGELDDTSEDEREAFYQLVLAAVKFNWMGLPFQVEIRGLEFSQFGKHARYTEILLESDVSALIMPHGIQVPLFIYKGEMVPATEIHEAWSIDAISSTLEGDDLLEEGQQKGEFLILPRTMEHQEDEVPLELANRLAMSVAFKQALGTHQLNTQSTKHLLN